MKIIKRIDTGSWALMSGAIGAAFGLVAGVFLLLFGGALSGLGGQNSAGLTAGFGLLGLILFPIIYGIGGAIGGLIFAALYNLLAPMVGGVKVDLEDS